MVACLSLRWKVLVCCAGEPLLPSWPFKAESRVKERQGFGSEPLCCGRNGLEGAAPFIGFQESFQTSSRLACYKDLCRLGDPQLDSPESGMLLHPPIYAVQGSQSLLEVLGCVLHFLLQSYLNVFLQAVFSWCILAPKFFFSHCHLHLQHLILVPPLIYTCFS